MKLDAKQFNINDHIFFFVFDDVIQMNATTMRPQEYLESPQLRGQIFTRDDVKKTYINTTRENSEYDQFNYYTRWAGKNFSSDILKPFYDGKFDPLTEEEQALLDLFKDQTDPFYFISASKNCRDLMGTQRHEVAHALFFLDETYKEQSLAYMSEFDLSEHNEIMLKLSGYHKDVIPDETQAYAVDRPIPEGSSHVRKQIVGSIPDELHKKMLPLFEDTCKKHNLRFFTEEELVS